MSSSSGIPHTGAGTVLLFEWMNWRVLSLLSFRNIWAMSWYTVSVTERSRGIQRLNSCVSSMGSVVSVAVLVRFVGCSSSSLWGVMGVLGVVGLGVITIGGVAIAVGSSSVRGRVGWG